MTTLTDSPSVIPAAADGASNRRRSKSQVWIILALSVLTLVSLAPYLLSITVSFKDNLQFAENSWAPMLPLHFENYAVAWKQIQPYMLASVIVSASSILGILVLSTLSGFILARYRFPGRNFFFAVIAALMMVPSIASLIPLFLLMRSLDLLNTFPVLIIPHIAGGAVLGTILMKTFIEGIPQSLFDAARVDGASAPRLFLSIMLPLSMPVIGTVGIITVNGVWNDFFWPLLTITDDNLRTASVGLLFFQGQNATAYGPMFAGYLLASLPLLILFIFFSKYFLAGIQGGLPGSH